jgi:hypothetical protein
LAILADGVRRSEEELVCRGLAEVFPVLIELHPGTSPSAREALEYREILQLVFRSQEEADAFRFRPVEEFDTEALPWKVDAGCFGAPGDPRFTLRSGGQRTDLFVVRKADRILAGINCLLSLGDAEESCREAAVAFLSGHDGGQANAEQADLPTVCRLLETAPAGGMAQWQASIVSAFVNCESASPQELLEVISKGPAEGEESFAGVGTSWLKVARDVASNRMTLSGDHLSDQRAILLRGALLALFAESTEALASFLHAPSPSGPRVTSTAAFLAGLKEGLIAAPWHVKEVRAHPLSSAVAALRKCLAEGGEWQKCVSVVYARADESAFVEVSVGGVALARWPVEIADKESQRWREEFTRHGYDVVREGPRPHTWIVRMRDALDLEVELCSVAGYHFPRLSWRPADGQKLKGRREIAKQFDARGTLWYPGMDSDGGFVLHCEMPSLPAPEGLDLVEGTLREAVAKCVAPTRPPRKRGVRPTSGAPERKA